MADTITQAVAANRASGWDWVRSEFERVRDAVVTERERLLGPDRGE